MPEKPEIPEAKDPFGKQVAVSIAIMAVLLSVLSTRGDHARTTAIIRTAEASDQWSFYQAKRLKEHLLETENNLLNVSTNAVSEKVGKAIAANNREITRYQKEQEEIKKKAEELAAESRHEVHINERSDFSTLFLQIAIVLCSVAILSRAKAIWIIGMLTALAGFAVGVSAFLL